jgi:hypothetical protein
MLIIQNILCLSRKINITIFLVKNISFYINLIYIYIYIYYEVFVPTNSKVNYTIRYTTNVSATKSTFIL